MFGCPSDFLSSESGKRTASRVFGCHRVLSVTQAEKRIALTVLGCPQEERAGRSSKMFRSMPHVVAASNPPQGTYLAQSLFYTFRVLSEDKFSALERQLLRKCLAALRTFPVTDFSQADNKIAPKALGLCSQ